MKYLQVFENRADKFLIVFFFQQLGPSEKLKEQSFETFIELHDTDIELLEEYTRR